MNNAIIGLILDIIVYIEVMFLKYKYLINLPICDKKNHVTGFFAI